LTRQKNFQIIGTFHPVNSNYYGTAVITIIFSCSNN